MTVGPGRGAGRALACTAARPVWTRTRAAAAAGLRGAAARARRGAPGRRRGTARPAGRWSWRPRRAASPPARPPCSTTATACWAAPPWSDRVAVHALRHRTGRSGRPRSSPPCRTPALRPPGTVSAPTPPPPRRGPLGARPATGLGSLPGTDPAEAARLVLGELPDLPFLPELPGRGAVADLTGRTCALLVDLPVDLQPGGWRLVERPGRDQRRAEDALARDLDALEEAAARGAAGAAQGAGGRALDARGDARAARARARPGRPRGRARPDREPGRGACRCTWPTCAGGCPAPPSAAAARRAGAAGGPDRPDPHEQRLRHAAQPCPAGRARRACDRARRRRRRARRSCTAAPRTRRCACCARPAPARSRSTPRCSPSPTTTRSARRSRPAPGCCSAASPRSTRRSAARTTCWPRSAGSGAGSAWRPRLLAQRVVLTPTCGLAGASTAYARRALQACVHAGAALREEPL